MAPLWLDMPIEAEAVSPASAVPAGFLSLGYRLQQSIDRRLGYFGQDRFVIFYYEPRGEEVIWSDSRSYGFASGAWRTFTTDIAPLADEYDLNLGTAGRRADHVLVVDRRLQNSYLADRKTAERFVARQNH